MDNLCVILYGDFWDIVCLSALTNAINSEVKKRLTIITQKKYKKFLELYSSANNVIEFDEKNIWKTIEQVENKKIGKIIDLHNTSFNENKRIERLQFIDPKKIEILLSKNRFDVVKNSNKNIKIIDTRVISEKEHQINYYARRIWYTINENIYNSLVIKPQNQDIQKANQIKKKYERGSKLIGIIPYSLRSHKELPKEKREKIVSKIRKMGDQVMVFGSKHELKTKPIQNVNYETQNIKKIEDYIPYILCCDEMVSIDTGLKHLSGYMWKKVTSIYWHASPKIRWILGENEIRIESNEGCSPCNNPFSCKFKKAICMESINIDRILKNIYI